MDRYEMDALKNGLTFLVSDSPGFLLFPRAFRLRLL